MAAKRWSVLISIETKLFLGVYIKSNTIWFILHAGEWRRRNPTELKLQLCQCWREGSGKNSRAVKTHRALCNTSGQNTYCLAKVTFYPYMTYSVKQNVSFHCRYTPQVYHAITCLQPLRKFDMCGWYTLDYPSLVTVRHRLTLYWIIDT